MLPDAAVAHRCKQFLVDSDGGRRIWVGTPQLAELLHVGGVRPTLRALEGCRQPPRVRVGRDSLVREDAAVPARARLPGAVVLHVDPRRSCHLTSLRFRLSLRPRLWLGPLGAWYEAEPVESAAEVSPFHAQLEREQLALQERLGSDAHVGPGDERRDPGT